MALIAIVFVALAAFVNPASATGGSDAPADAKPVTFCHYDGSNDHGGSGKYSKITTDVAAFYKSGHIDHTNDIWDTFRYVTKGGDIVTVPAQGDVSLLAFDDCVKPVVSEEATLPAVSVVDNCGRETDAVTAAPARGLTSEVTKDGNVYTVTATAAEGFTLKVAEGWTLNEAKTVATKTVTLTNDDDCGLPDTGSAAQHNIAGGIGALILAGLAGFFLTRRRKQA